MPRGIIEILREGILSDEGRKGVLSDNAVAGRLLNYLQSPIPKSVESLLAQIKVDKSYGLDVVPPQSDIADRRLNSLYLANVRQYSTESENCFYKLPLNKDSEPISCVYHGHNGSGKTTLFSALEMFYLNTSHIAEIHGYGKEDIRAYLASIGKTYGAVKIVGNTPKGEFEWNHDRMPIGLSSAFCSEYDVFQITALWNLNDTYIESQIGVLEISDMIETLRTLTEAAVVASEIKAALSKIADMEIWSIYVSGEVRRSLKKWIDVSTKDIQENKEPILKQHLAKIKSQNLGYDKLVMEDESIQSLKELIDYLRLELEKVLKEFQKNLSKVLPIMMRYHFPDSEGEFEIGLKDNHLKIELVLKGEGDKRERRQPCEYFNTFRLKLFCVAFKLALFCSAQIYHKINMPFIVDDIFDSSDFINRSRIHEFITQMIDGYNEIIKDSKSYPLQLIFFTQDNLIGENVYRGIKRAMKSDDGLKYSRLFRPSAQLPEDFEDDRLDIEGQAMEIKAIVIEDPIY